MRIDLKTVCAEGHHTREIAAAIVEMGLQFAPSFRCELTAFAQRTGVHIDKNKCPGTLNLFVLHEVVRFANSVVGQAVLERIWDKTAMLAEPIHEPFFAREGNSKCISQS